MTFRPSLPALALSALSCALFLSAPGQAGEPRSVAGTVRFLGAAPAPKKLEITQDQAHCGKEPLYSEELVVGADKGLKNVVVFVKGVQGGKAGVPGTVTLDNVGCRYEPHVVAMVAGSTLKVGNKDPVLHNTHARLPKADVFNIALPLEGQVIDRTVEMPGLMKVGCDAGHSWMTAWIASFDHPYFAVTDAAGRFSIPDLPPGEYQLVTWHEKLGQRTQPLAIASADATADVNYE